MANVGETFSFRAFDMFRRFVEVLKLEPDLMKDFQSGAPTKKSCIVAIKKVFCHNQREDRVKELVDYLKKNADAMVKYATIPHPNANWNNSIMYTDKCISLIKKYLRQKHITMKNIETYDANELAAKIAVTLYTNPKQHLIEAIAGYLKYDFKNPKRNITAKAKAASQTKNTEESANMTVSSTFNESSIVNEEKEIEVIDLEDELPEQVDDISFHFMMTENMQIDSDKQLSKMKDRLELEKILITDDVEITPADLLTDKDISLPNNKSMVAEDANNNGDKPSLNDALTNGYQCEFTDYVLSSLVEEPVKNAKENSVMEDENEDQKNIDNSNVSLNLKRKSSLLIDTENDIRSKKLLCDTTSNAIAKEPSKTADEDFDFRIAKIQPLNPCNSQTTGNNSLKNGKENFDTRLAKNIGKKKVNNQMTLRSVTPKNYCETNKQKSSKCLNPFSLEVKRVNNVQQGTNTNQSQLKKIQTKSLTSDSLNPLHLQKKIIQNSNNIKKITAAQTAKLKPDKSTTQHQVSRVKPKIHSLQTPGSSFAATLQKTVIQNANDLEKLTPTQSAKIKPDKSITEDQVAVVKPKIHASGHKEMFYLEMLQKLVESDDFHKKLSEAEFLTLRMIRDRLRLESLQSRKQSNVKYY